MGTVVTKKALAILFGVSQPGSRMGRAGVREHRRLWELRNGLLCSLGVRGSL